MEKQFVPYEIALKLKELGFDEECFGYYSEQHDKTKIFCLYQEEDYFDEIRLEAPLWQQVIDWFDNKNIIIGIDINPGTLFYRVHLYKRYYHNPDRLIIGEYFLSGEFNNFISKEEAREQAILKAIELCQK